MAAGDPVPASFPPMGAEFVKPYMEFEYQGKLYRLDSLAGGHNGRVAQACQASPPVFDEEKQRWVVPIENNLVDIDLSQQPEAARAIPDTHAWLREMRVASSTRNSYKSTGLLITDARARDQLPRFPVDCVFSMHIRIKAPGKPALINVKPFQLVAKGLEQWPPQAGTVYKHEDTVELFPEWMPFAEHFMEPVARILPGDETILTRVFEAPPPTSDPRGIFRRVMDRLT